MSYKLKKLNKSFASQKILNDFTIVLPHKGIVCLFGESGCGKTTLINIMAGIVDLDDGNINDIKNASKSYVFQEDRLIPWLSVGENITFVSGEAESDHCKAVEILESLNLMDVYNKKPSELSGGMRQRVNISRALFVASQIVFLDEPFKGIDNNNKILAINAIKKYVKDKLCVMVTHNMEEANIMADKIYFVEGPPLEILDIKPIKHESYSNKITGKNKEFI